MLGGGRSEGGFCRPGELDHRGMGILEIFLVVVLLLVILRVAGLL